MQEKVGKNQPLIWSWQNKDSIRGLELLYLNSINVLYTSLIGSNLRALDQNLSKHLNKKTHKKGQKGHQKGNQKGSEINSKKTFLDEGENTFFVRF